jgi:hypothetical protein
MSEKFDSIKDSLLTKACLKQDVYSVTKQVFADLNQVLGEVTNEMHDFISPSDSRVSVELSSTGICESYLTMAGDTVIFHMHTNVFSFPESHMIHRNSYVSKNPENAYCGVINIYNFLTDSFRFNRMNDYGYMVGRIFVNKDRHFFVEGKKQLGFLFNDFGSAVLDKAALRDIVETALQHVIEFDLLTPPYDKVNIVSLDDVKQLSQNLKLKTGKRLGFRFESDENEVEF